MELSAVELAPHHCGRAMMPGGDAGPGLLSLGMGLASQTVGIDGFFQPPVWFRFP
ncbi:hypothetical protein [Neorhodopirellula lusitana]|uniref:hypothetical protein n=1 Tax=Neorhodopirellula lusitana TaxID=445327 RepID=UPI003850D249